MPFPNAAQRGLKYLYHWQRFDRDRLEVILRQKTIYCSRPSDFNDPWDCRPCFNTDILSEPAERARHIEWAVELCRRQGIMSEADIARMQEELQDGSVQRRVIEQNTVEFRKAVLERYRVYCLCPDVTNLLLWAHYGDSHCGVCLEFNVQDPVICCALEVQYSETFPMTRLYSKDLWENLLPLLVKSKVWEYEREYRLIAQEASKATPHDTLITHNGQLKFPDGALDAIIVGCNGPYDEVADLVGRCNPDIAVRRARKIDNRYAIEIES